jgi:hypothetical protein
MAENRAMHHQKRLVLIPLTNSIYRDISLSDHPDTKPKRGQSALPASVTRLATQTASPRGANGKVELTAGTRGRGAGLVS